jgi:hypothetical protein
VTRAKLSRLLGKSDGGEIVIRISGKTKDESDQSRDGERRPKPFSDRFRKIGSRLHAAIDVDIAPDESFHDRELVRREKHAAKRRWPIEDERKRRGRLVSVIDGAIPEPHIEVALARLAEKRSQHRATARCRSIVYY